MGVLEHIDGPSDLADLDPPRLDRLAAEIRSYLVSSVCSTGGHLGPNLGVVELTLALHRVFDSPREPIVFDTGHQAYVHKLVTGRRAGFPRLRTSAGLSGYPNRAESVHDVQENSHASTALSYADGLSRARVLAGQPDDAVVAVVGDGALTGGLAWEALNNIGRSGRHVVVVLNDNGRSYAPTVGALPAHLSRLADRDGFSAVQALLGRDGDAPPYADTGAGSTGLFGALGFTCIGPVDGHDRAALEVALTRARTSPGPVLVHCLTEKGHGYRHAERDEADRFHTVGRRDPESGVAASSEATWTDAFAEALLTLGERRSDVVAVSAAMMRPTGVQRFADRFPDRAYDVGIAEQHAATMAAGLALGGLHPVVAVYATFANRSFDQVLLDVGMHRLPVTFVLDRAGVTGPDGPSHHGMWDLAAFGTVPGLRVAAPRDAQTLTEELGEAVGHDGPTLLRFPKATLGAGVLALGRVGQIDVLHEGTDVLVVAVGATAAAAVDAARSLADHGISCTVVDPRWVLPVDDDVVELAARHRMVVSVEDGVRSGGVGSRLAQALTDGDVQVPAHALGLEGGFLRHRSRSELLAEAGLDANGIAASIERLACGVLPAPTPTLTVVGGHRRPRGLLR